MVKSTPKFALHLEDLLQQMDKDAKIQFQGLHFSTPGMLARRAACGPSAVGKFAAPVPSQQEISVLFQGVSARYQSITRNMTSMTSGTGVECPPPPPPHVARLQSMAFPTFGTHVSSLPQTLAPASHVTCPVPSTTSSTSIASTTCYMPSSTWSITSGTAPHAACPPAFLTYGARPLAPPAYTL